MQGIPVVIRLRVRKWRCDALGCERSIFAERLPGLASPHARRSDAIADILTVMGHGAGGETSRRLLAQLGIAVSGDTVLRHLKRRARRKPRERKLRVVGVDEWAWRKGAACGTILVDLETRTVADLLPDRSSASLASWLIQHPGVEIVCRDRHGLYAEGARVGAPQARQVADRFHLVQNLRDRIEQHLSGQRQRPIGPIEARQDGADRTNLDRADRLEGLQRLFARVHELCRQGWTAADISRHLDINRRRIGKWLRLEALPERSPCDPKPTSPLRFHAQLQELMRQGVTKIKWLFAEAKKLGYKGSFGHMARYVAYVRSIARANGSPAPAQHTIRSLPLDPASGSRISPVVAAAICMKPRPLLTERQVAMLTVLKEEVPGFAAIRHLAIRFQSLLRQHDGTKLDRWLDDAKDCGIPAVVNFAKTLMIDIQAVRNAVIERWSNGQTEGQINRLKTLKRAMFGRANTELLRARLLPLGEIDHRLCG